MSVIKDLGLIYKYTKLLIHTNKFQCSNKFKPYLSYFETALSFLTHRGGPLTKDLHYKLMKWACKCAKHVLPLAGKKPDMRLISAFRISEEWTKGKASVGDARKASVSAIRAANELKDPVSIAIARAVGHTVATAHVADHSLGSALYALKAIKYAGKPVDAERRWQVKQLQIEIKELVLYTPKYKYIEKV